MAAGDVVITADLRQGGLRFMGGTVTLDGANPTPVDLSAYMSSLLVGVTQMSGSVAPGDDPNLITQQVAAASVLNVYAWKNTSGTDPTQIASTDNARLVDWFAIGLSLIRKGS